MCRGCFVVQYNEVMNLCAVYKRPILDTANEFNQFDVMVLITQLFLKRIC
jgi:hypothetical protein